MDSSRPLYEQMILEHNKSPRNFREMPDATRKVDGVNPLCGDKLTVYARLEGDRIDDISFQGCGCAISKSSASLMTTLLKGKTVKEAEELFVKFHGMVTSAPDTPVDKADLGKLMVFSGVREFPVRIKCATLAWHTMLALLDKRKECTVSTEQ